MVLALLLGIPTLRLRADYLAIATIAAAEIVRLLFRSATLRECTGGSNGLNGFDGASTRSTRSPRAPTASAPGSTTSATAWILLVGWALVALACAAGLPADAQPWGRVLKGIREDEDAVRSLGKNVYALQDAGAGHRRRHRRPGRLHLRARPAARCSRTTTRTEFTFFAYTVLLLGGAARVLGPVVGAIDLLGVLSLSDTLLRQAIGAGLPARS